MHRGLRGVLGKKIARLQIGLRGLCGVLGKKIARLIGLRGVGEEDRGLCLRGVACWGRKQRARVSTFKPTGNN